MSIQSAINQGIAVTSLLASQSPGYKEDVEKRNLNRSLDKIESTAEKAFKEKNAELKINTVDKVKQGKIEEAIKSSEDAIANLGNSVKEKRMLTDPINKRLAELGDETAMKKIIKNSEKSPDDAKAAAEEKGRAVFKNVFDNYKQTDELEKMKEADKRATRKKAAKLQQAAFVKNYIASGGKLDLTTSFEQAKKERK